MCAREHRTRRSPSLLLLLALAASLSARAERPQARASDVTLSSLAPLVDSVKSSVVNVEVRSRTQGSHPELDGPGNDLWERFFGPGPSPETEPREQLRRGLGSGVIIDPRGYVLTNNHVVESAVQIRIRLEDGRVFDAEVLGRDPLTDIALLKLQGQPRDLPVAKLGNSDAMQVGDWVVAIGNPFGLASSVSLGILSAKARDIQVGPYDDFLQTDAAINPGNSGGPLFNLQGEVIGINTAIVGSGTGIGFAVPSNMAQALLPQLEQKGVVTRGWLGVSIQDMTPELAKALGGSVAEGAVVADVPEDTPARKAGLRQDDVIVELDGKPINSAQALTRAVALMQPGRTVTLTFYRGDKKQQAQLTLGRRPDIEGVGGTEPRPEPSSGKEQLGLVAQDVPRQLAEVRGLPAKGALVVEVAPGSAAERAELEPGMVVIEAAKKPVESAADLQSILDEAKPGSTLLLRIKVPGGTVLRALTVPG